MNVGAEVYMDVFDSLFFQCGGPVLLPAASLLVKELVALTRSLSLSHRNYRNHAKYTIIILVLVYGTMKKTFFFTFHFLLFVSKCMRHVQYMHF